MPTSISSFQVERLARALCEEAEAFGWRDDEGRPLRTWDSLRDGSSRAEFELTKWRTLATRALELFAPTG